MQGSPTGSAVDVDSEEVDMTNPAEKLDWNKLCRISKWPNLDVYFEHFGQNGACFSRRGQVKMMIQVRSGKSRKREI